MPIIKIHKKNKFVIVDNKLAKNKYLTLKAKGLMLYLLSLPSDKNITVKELEKHTIEGLDALHNAVSELVSEGYIIKLKYRDEKGLFQTEYTVYEYPQETNQSELSELDKPYFRSKEIDISTKEKKEVDMLSSSSDLNRELQLLGIGKEETKKILEEIDDDDKLKLIIEKIGLLKTIIKTGTVKNPSAYALKAIKSINYQQIKLQKEEKRQKSILRAEKKKRDLELTKKERKDWKDDLERRKEESGDISKVVSDFMGKMNEKSKIGGMQ